MLTFIYKPEDIDKDIIIVGGSEAHHITKVLRLKKGELVRLIDGEGLAHICEIQGLKTKSVICRVIKSTRNSGEAAVAVTLAIGLSTGLKFDTVVEKGTEVGVRRFVPLITEKGKIRISDEASVNRKLKRWKRVAEAAAKQSARSVIPIIENLVSFNEFICQCSAENSFLFHPDEKAENQADIIRTKRPAELILLIGPESGFSSSELETARSKRIPCYSLGGRILRTETAGVVLPTLIIYSSESFNS